MLAPSIASLASVIFHGDDAAVLVPDAGAASSRCRFRLPSASRQICSAGFCSVTRPTPSRRCDRSSVVSATSSSGNAIHDTASAAAASLAAAGAAALGPIASVCSWMLGSVSDSAVSPDAIRL